MMNVGHCSICLGNFTASDMGVLRRCMHTFHRDCIGRAVRLRRECPLCRGEATMQDISTPIMNTTAVPHNLTKEALDIALGYYDKIVVSTSSKAPLANNCAGSASSSSDQREQLRACLVNLLSTLDDRAEQKEETWQRLVDFIKMASIASIGGVLAFFCFLYWPMIAPLAGTLASTAWSLIVRLCGFVRSHFPEILGGICGLMEMWVIWKESSIIDEEEAEVARLAEEEQQQQAADWN